MGISSDSCLTFIRLKTLRTKSVFLNTINLYALKSGSHTDYKTIFYFRLEKKKLQKYAYLQMLVRHFKCLKMYNFHQNVERDHTHKNGVEKFS